MAAAPQHYLDSDDFIPLIVRLGNVKPVHLLEIWIGQCLVKIKAVTYTNGQSNEGISQGFDMKFTNKDDCSSTDVKCELIDGELKQRITGTAGNYMAEAVIFLEKFFEKIKQHANVRLFTVALQNTVGYEINGNPCVRPLKKFLQERADARNPLTVYTFHLACKGGSGDSREIHSFLPFLRFIGDEELVIEQRPVNIPETLSMDGFVAYDAQIPKKLTVEKKFLVAPNSEVLAQFEHFDVFMEHDDMTFDFAVELILKLDRSLVFKSGVIKTSFDSANSTNNSRVRDACTEKFKNEALDLTEAETSANILKWNCLNQGSFSTSIIFSIEGNWKFTFLMNQGNGKKGEN